MVATAAGADFATGGGVVFVSEFLRTSVPAGALHRTSTLTFAIGRFKKLVVPVARNTIVESRSNEYLILWL